MSQTLKTAVGPVLATESHVKYIQSLDTKKDELDYWLTEHLRLNGVYWGLVALHLLKHPEALPRQETIDFVLSCQHDNGGFGAAPNHDAHMLSTVSAVQILVMVDGLDQLESKGKGNGKAHVAQCKRYTVLIMLMSLTLPQSLPTFRIVTLAPLLEMNGAKRIHDSCMEHSMHSLFWDCCPWLMWTKLFHTWLHVQTLTVGLVFRLVPNRIQGRYSPV